MSDCVLGEIGWTQRRDLRELSVQVLNGHYACDFSFLAHLGYAELSGISLEQQAAIPLWRSSRLFDEQRLVIEYTLACVAGDVPGELFERVKTRFGEAGAVEFTVTVGWWSLWAMLLKRGPARIEHRTLASLAQGRRRAGNIPARGLNAPLSARPDRPPGPSGPKRCRSSRHRAEGSPAAGHSRAGRASRLTGLPLPR